MQQKFGASIITNKQETKSLSYVVFFKKMVNKDVRISLFNKIKNIVGQNIWTNEKIDYIVVELNLNQKQLINKDISVSFISEVNIDLESLKKLMKGDYAYIS